MLCIHTEIASEKATTNKQKQNEKQTETTITETNSTASILKQDSNTPKITKNAGFNEKTQNRYSFLGKAPLFFQSNGLSGDE